MTLGEGKPDGEDEEYGFPAPIDPAYRQLLLETPVMSTFSVDTDGTVTETDELPLVPVGVDKVWQVFTPEELADMAAGIATVEVPDTSDAPVQTGGDLEPDPPPELPPDPGPPGPGVETLRKFDVTVFGQSYSRYKAGTIGPQADRHAAIEHDTAYTLSGTLRRGSGVMRVYEDTIGTWSNAKKSFFRDGLPVIFSFKSSLSQSEASFKTDIRAFLDSKPVDSEFLWFAYHHEPDDDIYVDHTMTLDQWINRNLWIREVLDEVAYSSRTDIRFGPIFTGTPFASGTSAPRRWNDFYDAMTAARGDTDTWDYMGTDRYQPAWDGPQRYMPLANWIKRLDEMFAATGLPAVIGEGGSPRPYGHNSGETVAQLDTERAAYMRSLYDLVIARGYFDAFCWWRVPALSSFENPFSTIMITPTGYNSAADATGGTGPPGGTDAQAVVNVHSEYCINSMADATPTIPFYTG